MAVPASPALPPLTFAVPRLPPEDTGRLVRTALETGYRALDFGDARGSEAGARTSLASAGDDLFLSAAFPVSDPDAVAREADRVLAALGVERLDLALLGSSGDAVAWRALARVREEGRVGAIGVAGWTAARLDGLIGETGVVPAVHQVELHPWLQQAPLREFHASHGITTSAVTPLARGALLADETITALGAKYGKTPAQIVLRWHLHLGTHPVPASATPARMRENLDVFDFDLADDDLAVLAELDNGTRVGPPR